MRSVDSVVIDSKLEIGTVIGTDSTLFVVKMGELIACATVVDNVIVWDSVVSAFNFGVVDVNGDSCKVVDADMVMDVVDDDEDDGRVTSTGGYLTVRHCAHSR